MHFTQLSILLFILCFTWPCHGQSDPSHKEQDKRKPGLSVRPNGRTFVGHGRLALSMTDRPDVKAELNLSDDQTKKLRTLWKAMFKATKEARKRNPGKSYRELSNRVGEEHYQQARTILKQDQTKRLDQIAAQLLFQTNPERFIKFNYAQLGEQDLEAFQTAKTKASERLREARKSPKSDYDIENYLSDLLESLPIKTEKELKESFGKPFVGNNPGAIRRMQ